MVLGRPLLPGGEGVAALRPPGNIVIVDVTQGRDEVIGEMDKPSAKLLLFNEAIYLHSGDQYVVKKLDLENQRCYVEETTPTTTPTRS